MARDIFSESSSEATSFIQRIAQGFASFIQAVLGGRYFLFASDYFLMKFTSSHRHRELAYDQLICRFCDTPVELMGKWRCECGYTRYGNYYGRCPSCLKRARYIDCPTCGSTMDVR